MALTKEQMASMVSSFGKNANDTGSAEVQIATLTERIKQLTEHMKQNHKDFSSRRGLLKMVARRRSLLKYVKKQDEQRYTDIKRKLGLK